ncbi:MAG: hypothetical protein ACREQI_09975 [Candidatus Binataceae bacterium]
MSENKTVADRLMERLETAIEAAELNDHPVFALCAEPLPPVRLPTLFAGDDAPLVKNFNSPPSLRYAGFDLEHSGNSRIIQGELRRALIPGIKILELWRDGALIYAVEATWQPCWGDPPDGSLRVNPLALSEPVYLFAELSDLIYREATPKPAQIRYWVSFRRLESTGKFAWLGRKTLDDAFHDTGFTRSRQDATAPDMDKIVSWEKPSIDAGAVAYEILREVYNWFGISDDGIPYTKKLPNGEMAIDPQALKNAGQPMKFDPAQSSSAPSPS